MKLSKAINLFWLDKKLEFSSRTVETYSYTFRYLVDYTNDTEIEAITKQDVLGFLDYLISERNFSKRSVHDAVARLSSLWSWASEELKVAHVVKGIDIKFSQVIIEPFTQEEVKRLVDATEYRAWFIKKGKRVRMKRPTALFDRAIILTLLDTGIRASELCALTLADYEEKTGRLFIRHGKGDKPRIVILGNRARKALFKYLATRENVKPTEPLLATRSDTFLRRDNLRHKLDRIGKAAQVEKVHPHRFRHTFAINFLRNGGNILTLQQLLGHSTLEMVKHYARIAEQDIDGAVTHSVADNWRL
jgi:integrase/recombinase XerD